MWKTAASTGLCAFKPYASSWRKLPHFLYNKRWINNSNKMLWGDSVKAELIRKETSTGSSQAPWVWAVDKRGRSSEVDTSEASHSQANREGAPNEVLLLKLRGQPYKLSMKRTHKYQSRHSHRLFWWGMVSKEFCTWGKMHLSELIKCFSLPP